ncbi:putative permease [Candidatus Methanoperedens nitroreducens]|uniref:Putative permease n=1 Tax=Candidatus Methanoperedens nitratireducens TaxID=1392998 RepID=A0A062V9X5_9EURY|nr:AI-2E family transporter [Candidatus Methanoperedens nitroreducens]KCZ72519.1 putative permease [Candidatus Methanoperedens nitroreducens]MDJ1423547.1 AI-2E family transporter [Candidatus Methanoperedens sp.]
MLNTQSTDGVSNLIKNKWKIALSVIILLVTAMFLYILRPLLDGIVLGIVLAYVARPMKQYLDRYVPRLSPYIATFAIVFPIFLIIGLGIIELFNQILWVIQNQEYVVGLLLSLVESFDPPDFVRDRTRDIILNFTSYLAPIISELRIGDIARTSIIAAINILIAILLGFYLLVDGSRLVGGITEVIPQEVGDFSQRFLKHFDGILSAIFIGNAYTAIVDGLLSLIIFSIFGFSNVLALSALMLIAAIIPIFAGWMVIVPLAIYRYFIEMETQSAIIFLIVSFVVIIALPELLIRPYIINVQSRIHPMLIIIAFTGGGLVGGIAGFFIAPILLGAIVAAYRANAELMNTGHF